MDHWVTVVVAKPYSAHPDLKKHPCWTLKTSPTL